MGAGRRTVEVGADPLDLFSAPVRGWFRTRFGAPTGPQADAWRHIALGQHVLLLAPTGSGKTLAAFLHAIDHLAGGGQGPAPGVQVLYISPLKALDNDVHHNLQQPLQGIAALAEQQGHRLRLPTAAVRTGDTPTTDRERQLRHPPDILITTPESLFILLSSPRGQRLLCGVRTVIVDEIHALAGNKRGSHLALSLERLEHLVATAQPGAPLPQRIGLSATQRPPAETAAFLGGRQAVWVCDHTAPRPLDLRVSVPVPDFRDLPGDSIWDSIAPLVLADIRAHRTTLVFVPGRAFAEMLTRRLNALAGEEICRAHHGSVSQQARLEVEAALRSGRLPALCATGTLELGIDVGAIDFVVQVGSPGAAARGLQRLGRAGHAVGGTSAGRIVCRTPLDLAEAAVLSGRLRRGEIEDTRIPLWPLDVLAQHLVSLAATADWEPASLLALVRGAAPYRDLPAEDFHAVLELVCGRYGEERFAGLRARAVFDTAAGVLRGLPGALRAAVAGAGTIADRGLFPVIGPDGRRLGELDEEFVHESRRGDVFVLGTTAWRIRAITPDRVLVAPGAGSMPRVPFWHGDGPGRPFAVGRELAAFWGEAERHRADTAWWQRQAAERCLEPEAAAELRRLLSAQADCGCLPTTETVALETYPDPLGDLRLAVHAPFGRAVTEPWAMALRALLRSEAGITADATATDGGFLLRLARGPQPPLDLLLRWSPQVLEAALRRALPRTPLFAAHFRECAGRALLLARGTARRRLPLWLQRLQAADLLAVASSHPDFPIVREALRECLEAHFDLPAWRQVLADIAAGRLKVTVLRRPGPSPFAAEMEFQFKAQALYRPDGPRAETAAADLAAVGEEPAVPYLEQAEAALAPRLWGQARTPDELFARFVRVGALLPAEVPEREALEPLLAARRVLDVGGILCAAEDAPLWRAAAGGEAAARLALLRRFAAAVPSVTAETLRARFAWGDDALLAAAGLEPLTGGRFADPTVRQWIRRRALALARAELAPVPRATFLEFVRRRQAGAELRAVLCRLQGLYLPVRVWLEQVLPAKSPGFRLSELERLVAHGEVLWAGRGETIAFYLRADYPALAPPPTAAGALLPPGSALWFSDLQLRSGWDAGSLDRQLRALAAAGAVTNDSLEPMLSGAVAAGARWAALPPAAPQAPAWARQLLLRSGVVTRQTWELAAPPVPWPALAAALPGAGAHHGYFVRGLGGMQFAMAADVDALRALRPQGTAVLAALDPAAAYRAAPRRPGTFLVLLDGEVVLQASTGGRRVRSLQSLGPEQLQRAASALRDLPGPHGRVEVALWDGQPVLDSPAVGPLLAAGFRRGPASLRWRKA